MFYDIIIIGGGAAGLMAACAAASSKPQAAVLLLEKMPRPGRKIMITGKGRCNFTNVKAWNEFSQHIRTNPNFLRPSFYNFTPEKLIDFLNNQGLETVVERGDRAFPASHKSSDVVDTLQNAARRAGAAIRTDSRVNSVSKNGTEFTVTTADGGKFTSSRLILATGGLSYPTTGCTGDGYNWAKQLGHSIKDCFPSLTAMVPSGYKTSDKENVGKLAARVLAGEPEGIAASRLEKNQRRESQDDASLPTSRETKLKGHIPRELPLSETGLSLCGIQLKNVGISLYVNGNLVQDEQGDIDFTDGGIEGPIGFSISRNCVKAIVNGAKVHIMLDLKPAVPIQELKVRVKTLWTEIQNDPRSRRMPAKVIIKVLLGKLMPWDMVTAFMNCNQMLFTGKKSPVDTLCECLKSWKFEIAGYVGYERCVVTAGGVSTDEVFPKTMESRICPGLYLCGELLDVDSDTGGYNLQTAFCTGYLAGLSSAAANLR